MISIAPGTITTIAGAGEPGCSGDGGPALKACLNEPKSVTIAGRALYIADSENHRIRKVDLTTGVITTVAGEEGSAEQAGVEESSAHTTDELDPLADPVKVKDDKVVQLADQSGTVRFLVGSAEKGRFKGDGGPANKAMLNEPVALALDEQRDLLYIADLANYRVRVVDLDTGRITTYAGNGEREYDGDGHKAVQAALSGPSGLALDAEGTLYIADTFSGRIRKIDLATRTISTVAGDGTDYRYQGMPNEFSTSLSRPAGIALAADGILYITDSDNHMIRKWNPKTKIITAIAGNGTAQFAGDGGPAQACSLNYPFGAAVDQAGHLYIADTFNHRIRLVAV